jgi:rubrerythrin
MRLTRRGLLAASAATLVAPGGALADADADRSKASLAAVLRLEQTALVAYEAIANSGVLPQLLRQFLEAEHQHAAELTTALDSMGAQPPVAPRRADIPGLRAATRRRAAALHFAVDLEQRTVTAYEAAIRDLTDANVMRTAAGAMGTDAQQLVVLRQLAGRPPVPRAFA